MKKLQYYFIALMIIIFLISRYNNASKSEENDFQDQVNIKKELTEKLDEWKAWKRSWYGPYPENKAALFEQRNLQSDLWKAARLDTYEILTLKSSYKPALPGVSNKNSIEAWGLVKVTLNVNKKQYKRYLEYHFYKELGLYGIEGSAWMVTGVWMYDEEEVKKEIKWTNSVLAW